MSSPQPDLAILETRVYRGPNLWSYEPSMHLVVDLGSLEDYPSDVLPGFVDGLVEALPGVARHSCSRGHRGGFLERLKEGTWLGHVAEHTALQLQQEAGHDIRRGKTRGTGVRGQYNVIYGYVDESVGLAAGALAVRLVNHLVQPDPEFDFAAELERFLVQAERTAFGPSTQAILDEAVSRDIPWLRLNQHSLVQLGQGVHQQRIRATMTSNTSALAVDIAGDKELTTRLLAAAGLPVPAVGVGADRRAGRARRRPHRLPRRVQAARRQPRPRCRAGHQGRRAGAGRLPGRPGRVAARLGRRRVVHHGQGLPRAGHRRPDGRAGRAGARARHRRRRAHRPGAGRRDQRRPATRCRAREGADAHQGRRRRRRARDGAGLRDGRRAARGHHGQADPDRQHVDRRHLDRPHPRGPPRQRRDRRGGRPGRRPGRRRHRLHLPRHRRAGARGRRRDLRGQRGPGIPDAHPPDGRRRRSSSRSPSSTRSSRPAPPAGSRSSR